jgi:hypothetical protein
MLTGDRGVFPIEVAQLRGVLPVACCDDSILFKGWSIRTRRGVQRLVPDEKWSSWGRCCLDGGTAGWPVA